ncbi:MAG: hypothetical protein JW820_02000 [Spirochaetales bacterium]|nr:hypothetical protein [Spirochaetales bacterium]
MGGICGIVNLGGAPVEPGDLAAMARAAPHRGPEGVHYGITGNAGFASLLSEPASDSEWDARPLIDEARQLCLAAEARLDNRGELLSALGARALEAPEAISDARLILAAYERWGAEVAAHLLGDFALALWDGRQHSFLAARDAMAMRPLYFRVEPGRLLFASEIKQILAASGVAARIYDPAIYVHLAGLACPLDWTAYQGIQQLQPAHALLVSSKGFRIWRYWDVDPSERIRCAEEAQYAEQLREIIRQAVGCRLRSRRPVGIMLSGGLDSTSAASMAGQLAQGGAKVNPGGLRAYCYAFERFRQCDERRLSALVVKRYGLESTDVPAERAWPLSDYPGGGPDRDSPFIGYYQSLIEAGLQRARADGVGLMISGDRGDLAMGGDVFDYLGLIRRLGWKEARADLRTHLEGLGASARSVFRDYWLDPVLFRLWPAGRADRLRGIVKRVLRPESTPLPPWIHPDLQARLRGVDLRSEDLPSRVIGDYARYRRYREVFSAVKMNDMVWSERTRARYGMGFADPWSDRRIASFAVAVPQSVLNRPGQWKRLTRLAMRGIVPDPVLDAPGWADPSPVFLDGIVNKARARVGGLLADMVSARYGYVDQEAIGAEYRRIRRGEGAPEDFWPALTLEMWLRRYWS